MASKQVFWRACEENTDQLEIIKIIHENVKNKTKLYYSEQRTTLTYYKNGTVLPPKA